MVKVDDDRAGEGEGEGEGDPVEHTAPLAPAPATAFNVVASALSDAVPLLLSIELHSPRLYSAIIRVFGSAKIAFILSKPVSAAFILWALATWETTLD